MEREHAYTELQLPQAPEDFLAGLQREFDAVAHQVERGLSNNPFVAIRHGRLHLKRRDALEVPPRLDTPPPGHRGGVSPAMRIEDLLRQVDAP